MRVFSRLTRIKDEAEEEEEEEKWHGSLYYNTQQVKARDIIKPLHGCMCVCVCLPACLPTCALALE
jgi:hypothetical protein